MKEMDITAFVDSDHAFFTNAVISISPTNGFGTLQPISSVASGKDNPVASGEDIPVVSGEDNTVAPGEDN